MAPGLFAAEGGWSVCIRVCLMGGGLPSRQSPFLLTENLGQRLQACFLRTERLFSLTWRGLIRKMEEDSSFFNEGEAVERLC